MLNSTYGQLSAGTRLEILGGKSLASADEEIFTVRLRTPASHKLREQGFNAIGVFDIEADYVTILRPREDEVPNPRWKRRIGKERKVVGIPTEQ